MEDEANKFMNILNEGYGKRAGQYLKDGGEFKLVLVDQTFSLSKSEVSRALSLVALKDHEVLL